MECNMLYCFSIFLTFMSAPIWIKKVEQKTGMLAEYHKEIKEGISYGVIKYWNYNQEVQDSAHLIHQEVQDSAQLIRS